MSSVTWLEDVNAVLHRLAESLPTPPREMVELQEPRDVHAEMLGVIEHTLKEYIEPAVESLECLLTITDEQLVEEFREWEEESGGSIS